MAHGDYQRPVGGSHLSSLTRSALLALRSSASLVPGLSYEITDHVQGRLVTGTTVTLLATSTTELSHDARVNTTYDNTSWFGLYDIDLGVVYELHDNIGNKAIGTSGLEVSNFDRGNTFIQSTTVKNSTWVTTYGAARTVINTTIEGGSSIDNSGQLGGSINDLTLSGGSSIDLRGSNISLLGFRVDTSSIINLSNYVGGGTLSRYSLYKGSSLNLSGSGSLVSLSSVEMIGSSIQHTGVTSGTITGVSLIMNSASSIIHSNGAGNLSLNRVRIENQGVISHSTGTISLGSYELSNGGFVTQNTGLSSAINISNGTISGSSGITNQGSFTVNGTRLEMYQASNIQIQAGATGTGTFTSTSFRGASNNVVSSLSTSGNITINQGSFSSQGSFQKTNIGILQVTNTEITSSSRINVNGSRNIFIARCYLNNLGQITSSALTPGITDAVNDSSLIDRGQATFSATGAAGNSIVYSQMIGVIGTISFTGTTTGGTVNQCSAQNGGFTLSNNTAPQVLQYSKAESTSNIVLTNMTVAKTSQTLLAFINSNITIDNPTGVGQHSQIYAVNQGNVRIWGSSSSSNLLSAMNQGSINQNGGSSTNITKHMIGTLTTGTGTHTGVMVISPTNNTLILNNTNRSLYLGVISSTPLV